MAAWSNLLRTLDGMGYAAWLRVKCHSMSILLTSTTVFATASKLLLLMVQSDQFYLIMMFQLLTLTFEWTATCWRQRVFCNMYYTHMLVSSTTYSNITTVWWQPVLFTRPAGSDCQSISAVAVPLRPTHVQSAQ